MPYDREPQLQEELKKIMEETVKEDGSKPETTENAVEGETVEPVVPEMSEIEKKARQLGWKSKEEREAEGKDNAHYVEPDEYVRRQPLFERIDRQNREIRETKERQRQIEQNLSRIRKEAYDQALRDLEMKRERAVQEANMEEFRRLDAQSKQIVSQMQTDPVIQTPVTQEPPEVRDFVAENKDWYNNNSVENSKMVAAAQHIDSYLGQQAQIEGRTLDPKQHLATIRAEVERLFPHRFNKPVVNNVPVTPIPATQVSNTVARSTAPVREVKNSSNLVSKLTPQQRELGLQFQKMTPEFTLEKYAQELEKSGRLGR